MRPLCLVALLLPGVSAAGTPTLEAARAQLRALKYADASRTLEQISTMPGLSRADAVDFYVLDGLVKGSRNQTAAAKASFQRALVLDPEAKLPGKVAPRVSTPFLEAKALARDHGRLALNLRGKTQGASGWTLDFALGRDDLGLVKQVVFALVEAGARREVVVEAAQVGSLTINALDAEVSWTLRGPRGWTVSSTDSLRLEAPPPPPPPPAPVAEVAVISPAPQPQPVASPVLGIVVIGAGALVAGVGGALLGVAHDAAAKAPQVSSADELRATLERGRITQSVGVPMLAVGGAAIATGVVMLLIRPAAGSVSVTPIPSGGVVVFSGAFP